jgi:hypothetical protein
LHFNLCPQRSCAFNIFCTCDLAQSKCTPSFANPKSKNFQGGPRGTDLGLKTTLGDSVRQQRRVSIIYNYICIL